MLKHKEKENGESLQIQMLEILMFFGSPLFI